MRKPFLLVPCVLAAVVGCTSVAPSALDQQRRTDIQVPAIKRPDGENAAWWFRSGAATAARSAQGDAKARNIILFVGDGMSLTTVAAARILEGQALGQPGEERQLSFEEFPNTALSRTYNTDRQTPDSAGTMSALVTGIKTRFGVISLGQQAERGACAGARAAGQVTALELAEAAGLSTGIVSTTRVTHATPAATYAHASDRNWESDANLSATAAREGCADLARQLVEFDVGDGIEVVLGGGRRKFSRSDAPDPEYPRVTGSRRDGRDLVAEWRTRYPAGSYVWNSAQLKALDLDGTERLFGLFEPEHMNYEHDRRRDVGGEPSLAEMTKAAIQVLSRNPNGYFLTVEGGRIDHAHHAGNAYRALSDTIAFSDAVRVAAQSSRDTLIIVTADHSHTLAFVGYPLRGNPILGKVRGSLREEAAEGFATDALKLPYTTLAYANGPGYAGETDTQPEGPKAFPHEVVNARPANGRPDLRAVDTQAPDYLQEATIPGNSETHGGDDVGVWATGPGASRIRGSVEQNVIFHWMIQSNARIVEWLCKHGHCEQGTPVSAPTVQSLHRTSRTQAR